MKKGISVPKEPRSLARNTLTKMIWKALSPIWVIYNSRRSTQILGLQLSTFHSVFYTDGHMVPLELWVRPPGTSFSCRYSSGKWLPPVDSGPPWALPPWQLAHLWRPHMVVGFRSKIKENRSLSGKIKGMRGAQRPVATHLELICPPKTISDLNPNRTFLTVFTKNT